MDALFLEHECKKIKTALCITETKDLLINPEEILSKTETEKYDSFKTEIGKQEFLLGRYSAKKAYVQLAEELEFKDIEIRNGIFEQPFFSNSTEFDLSIAHTKNIGAAIVFDRANPIGLDVETIDNSNVEALQEMTKDEEIENLNIRSEEALTIAWCLKEALTKAIKTGFTVPLELLKTEQLIFRDNVFECRFKNFMQYKGIAKTKGDYVIALAYPQQLKLGVFL